MGYITDFTGQIELTPALTQDQARYLKKFNETRRMKRDRDKAAAMLDPLRIAVGGPVGDEGCYFVGGTDVMGQNRDDSILEYNTPPTGQLGLWCQWVPDEGGSALVWDGGEKFYNYTEWMVYIIEHFLKPWGITACGQISWEGECSDDRGVIYVKNNKVEAVETGIMNPGPSWAEGGAG
ncbi:MAG: hypothetical protein AAGC72_05735 [Planctomycetota bacterium]